jgi:hypothetical protein
MFMQTKEEWIGAAIGLSIAGILLVIIYKFLKFEGLRKKKENEMDRFEHLRWCKERAMEYVIDGNNSEALASMASDLGKHPDTLSLSSMCVGLGMGLLVAGQLDSIDQGRKFIEGFN